MIEIIIGSQKNLADIVKLRLQAHKQSAQYDSDIVISENSEKDIEEQTIQELEDKRLIFLLAKENHNIIGLAILSISLKTDKTAFLGELFVEENKRGKGIGTMLLSRAIAISKKSGLMSFRATIAKNNLHALKFYEKQNFNEIKRNYLLFEKKL